MHIVMNYLLTGVKKINVFGLKFGNPLDNGGLL